MIQNIFYFVFGLKLEPEEFHFVYYVCIKSCIEVNDPHFINFYYKYEPYGEYWDRVKGDLNLIRVTPPEEVNGHKLGYAHKSDFIRLEMLNKYGGVYADMDTIIVNKISNELYNSEFVMGREDIPYPYYGLCNAFIMAKKKSYFGIQWYEDMFKVFNGSWNYHSIIYPKDLSLKNPNKIRVEPQESFYKHMWDDEGLSNLFVNTDRNLDNCYSLHLWSHVCWDKYLKNINEDSIYQTDSTYNLIARRFIGI